MSAILISFSLPLPPPFMLILNLSLIPLLSFLVLLQLITASSQSLKQFPITTLLANNTTIVHFTYPSQLTDRKDEVEELLLRNENFNVLRIMASNTLYVLWYRALSLPPFLSTLSLLSLPLRSLPPPPSLSLTLSSGRDRNETC